MSGFTISFGDGKDELVADSGKYRLIRGAFCPFVHQAVIAWSYLDWMNILH